MRGLIAAEPLDPQSGATPATPNGVYVHDRRSGERVEVVNVASRPLTRHATDELYGIALGAGLDADVTLVTGVQPGETVEPDLYRRLGQRPARQRKAGDRGSDRGALQATLRGGVDLLKLSDEELGAGRGPRRQRHKRPVSSGGARCGCMRPVRVAL